MANQVTLILLDDVAKLGLAGDEVVVKAGYARNYLIPRGLAAKATPGILRLVESRKALIAERRAKDLADAKALAEKIGSLTVKITASSGSDGRLYGSVTSKDISEALLKQHKIDIDKRKLILSENIKAYGTYNVEVKVYPEITATLKVTVTE